MTATDTPPTPDPTLRDRIRDVIAATLHGQEALACTRAWSAWSVGTMREDDFVSLADQDEAVDELADEVMTVLRSQPHRTVSTAAELRELGNAVAESPGDNPQAVLLGDCGLLWTLRPVYVGDPGEPPEVWMVDEARQCRWRADQVTEHGVAGYGPWTVLAEPETREATS